jgi:heme A synthase
MYPVILGLHNLIRWAAVILLVYALFRMYRGFFSNASWGSTDRKAGLFLTIAMDIQFLFGLLLYFVYSPLTKQFFQNFGGAMGVRELRFFGLEHVLYMVVALVLAHIGGAAGKKDLDDKSKFKRGATFFTLATLALLLGMPWFRPLLPVF